MYPHPPPVLDINLISKEWMPMQWLCSGVRWSSVLLAQFWFFALVRSPHLFSKVLQAFLVVKNQLILVAAAF